MYPSILPTETKEWKERINFIKNKGTKETRHIRVLCKDGLFRTLGYQKGRKFEYKPRKFWFVSELEPNTIYYD